MVWLAHVHPDLHNRESVLKVAPDMPSLFSLWLAYLAIRSMEGTASGYEYPPLKEKIFSMERKKSSMERKKVYHGKKNRTMARLNIKNES